MIRKASHTSVETVEIRNLWGASIRAVLVDGKDSEPVALYTPVEPTLALGLPFAELSFDEHYPNWPLLSELLPISFPGVKTSRDEFLVSIDKETLEARLNVYFDENISHEEMRAKYRSVMQKTSGFDGPKTRSALHKLGRREGQPVRFAYRPFDLRCLYWEPEEGLLDRARDEYWPHVLPGNRWITATEALRKDAKFGLRPDIFPEPFDVLKRLAFGVAGKHPFAFFGHAQPDRAQECGGGSADRRAMQAALFRGGGRLDPDSGFEIELIPARAQHFATPRACEQDQAHRIGGAV